MEELIKKQRKAFRKFAQWWWSEVNPKPDDVYNWHINSIKEILEVEVEVLKDTKPPFSGEIDNQLRNHGYQFALQQQIEHLTNIISNLK